MSSITLADRFATFLIRRNLRGATRFHSWFCQGRRITAKSKHGVRLRLDPHEYVDRFVLKCGYYEEEVYDALRSRLKVGDTFWDIGSNLGLHALTVAKEQRGVRVCAFEPNPVMSGLIRSAAQENGLEVQVLELALDSQTATAQLYLHEGNAGRSGLRNWENDPRLKTVTVTTRTGDAVVSEHDAPVPNVMKIDVEGNEERTLLGMPQILAQQSLHTVVFEDSPDEKTGTKTLLRAAGFIVVRLSRMELTHHNLENFVATRN